MGERYFIIAGEASGDIHAAKLIEQIRIRQPNARIAGLGGDKMSASGCYLYQDYRKMAFIGFVAVLANLKQIRENFRIAREALLQEKPDVLILVDYPSFNLQMASFCRKHLPNTKIYYYIPPKVWAWKRRRIHAIARLCDDVFGIFPFEPAFYAKYGYRCEYVGNPTAEEMVAKREKGKVNSERKMIAILPGSRRSEISLCLPRMLEAAHAFPDYQIVVTAAPGIEDAYYTPYLTAGETLTRETYATVQSATAAIVNSGTATLETALLGCPQVAVYHIRPAWLIRLIRWAQPLIFSVRWFTLVNIISDKEVIKECIANDFTVEKVKKELNRLLTDEVYRKEMLASYEHLSSVLGTQSASATVAQILTAKP
jgi:lipid-A-disaccharide synthase